MPRKPKKQLDPSTQEYHERGHAAHIRRHPALEPGPDKFHPERDLMCLLDLGVKFRDPREILVAGCGLGDDTWLLVEKLECVNVWGVDISRPGVNYWNNYFGKGLKPDGTPANLSRTTVGLAYRACGSCLPFDDCRFDLVLAFDVTEHMTIPEYLLFLANCYRVLKYGGRCAVLPGLTHRPEHVNVLSVETVAGHMQRAGFHTQVRGEYPWVLAEKRETSVFIMEEDE